MKKFIVAAIALVSMSAFADHHGRHMVTIGGWEDARSNQLGRTLDFNHSNGGSTHNTQKSIAVNYAYALTDAWQLGAEYAMWDQEGQAKATDEASRWAVFAIYNFAGQLTDTNYLAVKYGMAESEVKSTAGAKTAEAEATTYGLEFGHRFSLGTLWSMNFNWSPSIEAQINDSEDKVADDEATTTDIALNVLKVDVIF